MKTGLLMTALAAITLSLMVACGELVPSTLGRITGVAVSGRHAYVAMDSEGVSVPGLRIVDVSDSSRPVEVGSYGRDFSGVAASGNFAYLAGRQGLVIVDVSNPSQPREIGSKRLSVRTPSVAVSHNVAYLGLGEQGLEMVDVSNPTKPRFIARADEGPLKNVYQLYASGNRLYVGDYVRWVAFDITDPSRPTEIGPYLPGPFDFAARSGILAYVEVGGSRELVIMDVSNPSQPKRLGFIMLGVQGMRRSSFNPALWD